MSHKRKPKIENLESPARELTGEEAEAVGGRKHVANVKWTPGKASVGSNVDGGMYDYITHPKPPKVAR